MTFEPKHDAGRLGPLKADPTDPAAQGGELCSLADLVAWVMHRDGLPRRPAAVVVAELASKAPPLYLTARDTWARRLDAGHVWRRAVAGRAGGVRQHAVAHAGWVTTWGNAPVLRHELQRQVVKPRAAVPGAYGEPGAWQVLQEAWCSDDLATRDRAMKAHGAELERLAIPMRAAVDLIGYGLQGSTEPKAARPVASAGAAAAVATGDDARQQLPPNTPEGNRVIFEAWEAAGGKNGGTACLAARYGVTQRTIQDRICSIRDALEPARDSAKRHAKGKRGRAGGGVTLATAWGVAGKTGTHSR